MEPMTESPDIIVPDTTPWRQTLWAMVGIQLLMTGAFSFLSPIVPLMLPGLGVTSVEGVDIWSGVITGSTSFVAAFAAPVPCRQHRLQLGLSVGISVYPQHALSLDALMGAADHALYRAKDQGRNRVVSCRG